ncbi:MAG: DUF1858 domain-containing protein [Aquificaceae bacterium]
MRERITFDTKLIDLLKAFPEAKDVLMKYGYRKLLEEDIEDVVVDKLTVKGFCRLMDLDEEDQENLWRKIQNLYEGLEV